MYRSFEKFLYYLLIFLIPTQLGKHFWPDFASIQGIRIDYLSPTIYVTDIFISLLFIVWIFRKLKQQPAKNSKLKTQNSKIQFKIQSSKLQFKSQKYFPFLISALVISYLLSVIVISGRVLGGLYSLLKLLEMAFVAYYITKFMGNKNAFQKTVLVLGIGGIFQSLLAIAQFVKQGSIGGALYSLGERSFTASTPGIANASLSGELVLRPYGTLPHPNVLAGYLVVVMTLALFMLHLQKSKKEARIKSQESWFARQMGSVLILNYYFLIQTTVLILGSIALFLSMSRVAILLWAMILVWLSARNILCHSGLSRISLVKPLSDSGVVSLPRMTKTISLIVLLGSIGFLILSPVGSRFRSIKPTDESVVQRATLINSSFKMIGQSPLLGVGLGNFLPTLATIQKPLSTSTYLQPVHNIFLLVAAETGLISLGFFAWFLWKTLQRIKKQESRIKEPLLIVLSVILITGAFDHYWLTLQQGQLLLAFILGLCWDKTKASYS